MLKMPDVTGKIVGKATKVKKSNKSRVHTSMSTSEFAYLKALASSPIIEGTNPSLFYFARSLEKRAYEHASPRIEIED
jgi:hypothetical protein